MEDIYPEGLKPGDLVQGHSTQPWPHPGIVMEILEPTDISVRADVLCNFNIHTMYFRKNMTVRAYRGST